MAQKVFKDGQFSLLARALPLENLSGSQLSLIYLLSTGLEMS